MKRRAWIAIPIVLAVVLLGAFVYTTLPKHPTPSYEAADYGQLARELSSDASIVLPDSEFIPKDDPTLWVLLMDRMHDEKSGFWIIGHDDGIAMDIQCKDVKTLSDEETAQIRDLRGDAVYRGIRMSCQYGIDSARILFVLQDHRYLVAMSQGNDAMKGIVDRTARNIIDKSMAEPTPQA